VGTSSLRSVGGTLFFTASDPQDGRQHLWKSDGTPAGTVPVVSAQAPTDGYDPESFTAFNGRLVYVASSQDHFGGEIWVSDGTAAGTHVLKPLSTRLASPSFTEFAGRLWFVADDPAGTGSGLWSTDGTAAGARDLGAVRLDTASGFTQTMALGDRLFFAGTPFSGSGADSLWTSDGTVAGTAQLLGRDGNGVFSPSYFQSFAGRMFIVSGGGDLWQSDGTSAGTFEIRNLPPPPGGVLDPPAVTIDPRPRPAGAHLFFPAYDRATGTELWAIDAP
jgi:ELWxxDGT repeat protein